MTAYLSFSRTQSVCQRRKDLHTCILHFELAGRDVRVRVVALFILLCPYVIQDTEVGGGRGLASDLQENPTESLKGDLL